jgi:hypothetical protein
MTQQHDNTSSSLMAANGDDTNINSVDRLVFPYRFEDTPRRMRACAEVISPRYAPKDGKYKVVVTAIMFGKQLRSEGVLNLELIPSNKDSHRSTGWNIQGSSVFGLTTTAIQEGFINAEGHFYWILPSLTPPAVSNGQHDKRNKNASRNEELLLDVVLYRGRIMDLETFSFEDGEFQSLKSGIHEGSDGQTIRPEGRIVRLEYLGEDNRDHVSTTTRKTNEGPDLV